MDQQAQETQIQYESIINEVIGKLKKNSDKGQLQMSESEIQTFKDLWQRCLKAIQDGSDNRFKQHIQPQIKQNVDNSIDNEPHIKKKIKTNVDTQIIKKEENDDYNKDEDYNKADVAFSDDSGDETSSKEPKVDDQKKYFDYQNTKNESQREKTLFDKIRELEQLKNLVKVEEEDENESEEPKVFDTQVYAQKINTENQVSRIRPNKSQKMSLENVLIKEKNNKEALYPQAQLLFNFKTSKKKNSS
ncbi:unnamed protein product [Paramecium octaurelia]|uniref:Uncharacterized protein n=1 Tax=Paramecium octaurelia TaxID=43137 RepID=A0A8S1UCY5_PAROT|nr:unnamed protein product [Paramecium octaurelia]